jgi:DNA-binding winged helix-turn-helix (wHTH) protein
MKFGPLEIDVTTQKVMLDGRELDTLTTSEFNLLATMARYPGRVFSRGELVEKVLGNGYCGYERTIDTHIKNLRAKLREGTTDYGWIRTVHGSGYRFESPFELDDAGQHSFYKNELANKFNRGDAVINKAVMKKTEKNARAPLIKKL